MSTVALMDNFRDNVLAAMQRRQITHAALAAAVGLHRVTVTRILSGDVSPSVEKCEQIAIAVGERPDTIFLSPPVNSA